MDKEKAIQNIIENFDFERVHKVMTFLDWKWSSVEEVPTIGKLVTSAQKRLYDALERTEELKQALTTGSGGFMVHTLYNEETKCCDYMELVFQLTSWEFYEE